MSKQKNNFYTNLITSDLDNESYDLFLYQANDALYNFGEQYKSNNYTFLGMAKEFLRKTLVRILDLKFLLKSNDKVGQRIILSNAYVNLNLDQTVNLLPPWVTSINKEVFSSWKLSNTVRRIFSAFREKSIRVIFSKELNKLVNEYDLEFTRLLNTANVSGLIVPNDLSFFENLSLKIARRNGVPTFVYLHGLPGRYNSIDDNRADYLIVWGIGIKQAYVKAGFLAEKILTIKHPIYSNFKCQSLRSNLENVLVISKATSGTPSSSDEVILSDRTKSLYYLERVKRILKELGVSSAKLRLHPSESPSFYLKNLIDDFFVLDTQDKSKALSDATVVIGPTSTMILDAINSGVNYVLFDPILEGKTLDGIDKLVAPFDGSSFIRLSKDANDFQRNIDNSDENININLLNNYLDVDEKDSSRLLNILSI